MLNNNQAIERVKNTFNYPYSDNNYINFVSDLLNNVQTGSSFDEKFIEDEHITSYKKIGFFQDVDGDVVDILSVNVKSGQILERTRTKLRDFTVNHIRNSQTNPDGCLVAFHSNDFDDWRFSFVKMDYKTLTDPISGLVKPKEEVSEPKRFSFLIGKNEPSYTAQKQMIPLLLSPNVKFKDIIEAFSTESVTNDFYQSYRSLFENLTLSLVQIKNDDFKIKKNFEDHSISEDIFAKKLLGQIVFTYFIQRKGWLGIKKNSDGDFGEWGSGDKKFIRNLFNKKYCEYDNFFNDVLEHLFYSALGNENPNDYYSRFDCKIPFLSGGIYQPLKDYNWLETDINIKNETIEEILDVFDRYNFTIREESNLDKDVAIDPEMLGRVFENLLLGEKRKENATYYTPRSIVKYMSKESIINYLSSEAKNLISISTIDDFINNENISKLSKNDAELIDSLLKNVKICDPAIGSGAFPMGLLNQIVKSRSLLSIVSKKHFNKYDFKRYAIINSIYGVDIDASAVEIAKLRLFLSLIVDEENYSSIEPLPNLDFQIMQGNSLIDEFYGVRLDFNQKTIQGNIWSEPNEFDVLINNLYSAQNLFSNESNYRKKKKLKDKVEECIINIFRHKYKELKSISSLDADKMNKEIENLIHSKNERNFFPWKLYFANIFREKGGFDILIANPPYIQLQKTMDNSNLKYGDIYKDFNYQTFKRTGDIYMLFYELGINLLKSGGHLTYITSNKWMRSGYGKFLRKFFTNYNPKRLLDFGGFKVFKSATVDTNIISIQKEKNTNNLVATHFKNDFDPNLGIQSYFDKNKVELKNLCDKNWFIGSIDEILLREKIQLIGKKIKDWNEIKISYGIKTGFNEAFIIDANKRKELVDHDSENDKLIKSVIRGKDIKRFNFTESNLYMIATFPALRININNYPYIKEHLKSFGQKLKQTGEYFIENGKKIKSRKKTNNKWFETQDQINYYEEFNQDKIIWGNISYKNSFCISKNGELINAPANLLTSELDINYILGVMNSKVFCWEFENLGIPLGYAYEWKKQYVEQMHIPIIDNNNKVICDKISKLVHERICLDDDEDINKIERAIDTNVYKLYDLTEKEIIIIESNNN